MTEIIDCKKIKDDILDNIKKEILSLKFSPVFCDILVGDNEVSASYVRIKSKTAMSVGIKFRTANFNNSITTEELINEIENLNKVPYMCGVIVQLPLPDYIDKKKVLDAINPSLDVDCLGSINSDHFYNNNGGICYPTALACLAIIDSLKINLSNKNILVLGQGNLVGLPVTHLLSKRGLNVKTANRETPNTEELIKNADLIISAIGKAKYIKGNMVKKGVVIIDAGTSEDNGAVIGDVDLDSVMGIASFISPNPGGVGPITVSMLLQNVLQVAKEKKI